MWLHEKIPPVCALKSLVPKTIIETPRLLLCAPFLEDWRELAPIYAKKKVMRYIGYGVSCSPEETRASVQWGMREYARCGYGLFTARLKTNLRVVGRCGLVHLKVEGVDELELAYLLDSRVWGQGLASEAVAAIRDYALGELGKERLVALIHPRNMASKRVAQKAGMTFERQAFFSGIEAELFSLTRSAGGVGVRDGCRDVSKADGSV